jgi:hypothetical protein
MACIFCPRCHLEQPVEHRFCVRCGASLPAHLVAAPRAKAARFFAGIKVHPDDPEGAFLRVSSYRRDQTFDAPEGSVVIPGHHVRFSVWVGREAVCVISLPEAEARDLLSFLGAEIGSAGNLDTESARNC